MACAPFVWPRQSALSSTALASWPAPTTVSPWPSVTLPSRTSKEEKREKCEEDLLDNLILQAAEQKLKEDMLASLQGTSGKTSSDQKTGARKQLKKQTSPCQVKRFISRIYWFSHKSYFLRPEILELWLLWVWRCLHLSPHITVANN